MRTFVFCCFLFLNTTSASAGMENARFALHWKPTFSATKTINTMCPNPSNPLDTTNYSPNWGSTTDAPNPIPCTQYQVAGGAAAGQVYVVVGQAGSEGVGSVSFGINYSGSAGRGIDPQYVTWFSCADGLTFPNDGGHGDFPRPGGGIRV